MALIRQFYSQGGVGEAGDGYSLARDVLTDGVFVIHCKTRKTGSVLQEAETQIPIAEFLSQSGPAQAQLLELIGTLVIEE